MSAKITRFIRKEGFLYFVIWMSAASFPVIYESWGQFNGSGFEWDTVIRWWKGMFPLLVLFLINNHILIPLFLKKDRIALYVSSSIVLLLCCFLYQHATPPPPPPPYPPGLEGMPPAGPRLGMPLHGRPPHPLPFPLLLKFFCAVLIVGANLTISLIYSYNRKQDNIRELENFRLQEELKYLKQQISPHFFMNVLNNIHAMAEEDVGKAQEMILELSHLMRYVLYESENGSTTLAAESRFISSYVALMRRRYVEDVVRISLELPEKTSENVHIPPLLFISFIENAFKHGVSYMSETAIDIKLYEKEGEVIFTCTNTIPKNRPEPSGKGGLGLANVRRRLDLLYGKKYSLRIDSDEHKYSVNLIIPNI